MPVSVTYTFGSQTGNIPLSYLDTDFNDLVTAINGMLTGTQTFTTIAVSGGSISGATVWTASKITEAYGGTNQSTYTTGDMLYASASNTLSKLPVGTPGQVLTSVGGVPAWAAATSGTITNNTTPIAGGTSGAIVANVSNTFSQILPGTAGNVLLSSGTAWTSGTLQYTAAGTGAVARTYPAKLGDFVSVLDFGADPTGASDSTTAFQNAINSMGTLGGTVWVPPGLYNIDGILTVGKTTSPYISNVTLKGQTSLQTQPFNVNQLGTVACLRVNGSTGRIRLVGGCGLDGLRIIRKNMTFSASAASSYTGTAVETATPASYGSYVKNCMIAGFAQAIVMGGAGGYLIEDTYIDCSAGVWIFDSSDVSRVVRTHCYPFITEPFSPTGAQNQRSGSAFKFSGDNDWTTVTDCFSYGWLYGLELTGRPVMQIVSFGADNTAAYNGSAGILVGSITSTSSVNVTASLFAGHENCTYIDCGASCVVKFSNCDFWGAQNTGGTAGQGYRQVSGVAFLQNCYLYNNYRGYVIDPAATCYGAGVATRNNVGAASSGTIAPMPTVQAV